MIAMTMKSKVAKINREIRALAVPNVISNVSVPLISSVDTYLMGQLSPMAVAAVGVGSMVFNFLYWNMGFLRMGTTGLTAQAFGRKDQTEFTTVLIKAGFLGIVISILFVLLQVPLFKLTTVIMGSESAALDQIWLYFSIRIWAAPASLLLMVLMGWLFGMQNARFPLYVTIFINIINIVVSFYFVRQLGMGIAGVAWGTVLAQYLGLFFCFVILTGRYGHFFKKMTLQAKSMLSGMNRLLHVNKDIFIRTLFLSTAFLLIFRFSEEAGPQMLAVNVVFLQFLNWMSYAIDGFAYAAESLVGKYKGARDGDQLRLAINWNMIWGLIFAILFSLSYGLFADEIFALFMESDDGQIKVLAEQFFFWMIIMPIVGFGCYIWDGIFVGLTASIAMRNCMILAFVIYIATYYLMPSFLGNHRVWAAFFLFLISRGLLQFLWYRHRGWEEIR